MKRRGKDLKKLQVIMSALIKQKLLGAKHKDHTLLGEYHHCRECHIKSLIGYLFTLSKKALLPLFVPEHTQISFNK